MFAHTGLSLHANAALQLLSLQWGVAVSHTNHPASTGASAVTGLLVVEVNISTLQELGSGKGVSLRWVGADAPCTIQQH